MLQLTASTTTALTVRRGPNVAIVERIRGEFREMPGLSLTLAQACRLWSLDAPTCGDVLTELVETGFLSKRSDGAFRR